jgi:predicted NBD/HSP70 family sugar kinase
VVDERSGEVLLAPNLHWLDRVNLIKTVGDTLRVRVTCLQEIRAQAYGQLALEGTESQWPRDFLMVDFGEGLGAAAAVNGKVFVGPLALNGELGHTPVVGNQRKCGCGAIGCVETLMNRAGLLTSLSQQTRKRSPRWEDLVRHVENHGVEPWLSESLKQVATAIAAAANVMGIQRVIITGSLTELPPAVMDELSRAVVEGCLWKRFGQMICHAGPRHRLAGLVAAGIDRIVLPVESWER